MESTFIRVLGDTPAIRVLHLLVGGRDLDYTLKDIAECAEVSWPTVQKIIPEFAKMGIILKTKKIGRIQLYRLNKTNLLAQKIIEFEKALLNIIVDEARRKHKVLA